MNFAKQPPVDSPASSRFGDDLDGLLRAFFRAELPHPWPAWKAPGEPVVGKVKPPSSRWFVVRSRLALAASVALLTSGLWLLSGQVGSKGLVILNAPRDGEANKDRNKKLLDEMKEDILLKDDEAFYRIQFPHDGSPMK